MIKFQKLRAALRALVPKNLGETQASGARALDGGSLNYNSVNTLAPARLASAFAQADTGYITEQAKLYELIEERDPHIYAELNKRRLAITGLERKIIPPRDASQSELDRTQELSEMIDEISCIEDAEYDITDAIGKGFVALEFHWKPGDAWLPEKLDFIPQRLFQINRETGDLEYLKMGIPEPLRPFGWLVHEHRGKSGYIEKAALFRILAWTYAFKTYSVKDLHRFLELYGMPLRLGKFPAGIDTKQRNELLRAVRNIGNDGAGIIPSTMAIDFLQVQKGQADDFLRVIEYWERKQSLAILGGALTSQADGKTSTNALGIVHDKVRQEIKINDVKQISPSFRDQLLRPICLINGLFPENRIPHWQYDVEEIPDRDLLSNVLSKAVSLGMEIDVNDAHDILKLPKAQKGAQILSIGGKVTALRAALTQQPQETIVDNMARQLADLSMRYEQEQLDTIYSVISEAGDIESAIAQVGALNLNSSPIYKVWTDLMTKGMVAANLAGRAEAK